MHPEEKIKELGLKLPSAATPVANYVSAVRTGNLVFLSGHGPRDSEGGMISGKVGGEMTLEEGYGAAKNVGLNLLGSLKAEIGDLGYNTAVLGQKSYNGVAILSKYPLEDIREHLPGDDAEGQLLSVDVDES